MWQGTATLLPKWAALLVTVGVERGDGRAWRRLGAQVPAGAFPAELDDLAMYLVMYPVTASLPRVAWE